MALNCTHLHLWVGGALASIIYYIWCRIIIIKTWWHTLRAGVLTCIWGGTDLHLSEKRVTPLLYCGDVYCRRQPMFNVFPVITFIAFWNQNFLSFDRSTKAHWFHAWRANYEVPMQGHKSQWHVSMYDNTIVDWFSDIHYIVWISKLWRSYREVLSPII